MSALAILILTVQLVHVATAVKACYSPDGNQQPTDTPCDASATDSHCCDYRDVCLSNGLCFDVVNVQSLTRGSCTDATWSSPGCPKFCIDDKTGGGCAITRTPTVGSNAGFSDLFCCMDFNITTKRCNYMNNDSDQPFQIPSAELITDRSSGARAQNGAPSSVASTTTTMTTATKNIVTSGTQSTGLFTPASCTTNTPTAASNHTHCGQSQKLAIGAGIGIPILVALCAALIAFYFQKRQTTKFKLKLEEASKDNRHLRMAASMSTVKADTSGQQELDEIHVNEVDGRVQRYEMD